MQSTPSSAIARRPGRSTPASRSSGTPAWSMYATGINNLGQVTGFAYTGFNEGYSDTGQYQAFVTGANGSGLSSLGTLGGSWSQAWAINDRGAVVGQSQMADGSARAFLTQPGGAMTNLGTLGSGTNSAATAVNIHGDVVGVTTSYATPYRDSMVAQEGFITNADGAGMHSLGTWNGEVMIGTGINDRGQVVGDLGSRSYEFHGNFTREANGSTVTLASTVTHMAAINASGQTAGEYSTDQVRNDVFVGGMAGELSPLDFHHTLGYSYDCVGAFCQYGPASRSFASDINASGQVVGRFNNGSLRTYPIWAFITDANGQNPVSLDQLFTLPNGERFISATGINDLGQFIANTDLGHAYLISPVPEPAVLALWAMGLLWLAHKVMRRRVWGNSSWGRQPALSA